MTTSINPIHPSMSVNAPIERRFYPRITPSVPIYVAFGPSNLGALLNISENGFQVVTPNRLDLNSVYRVFLSLDGIARTITVSVRTIWTADSQNSSGIQLLDLSDEDRQQIRNWVAARSYQPKTRKIGLPSMPPRFRPRHLTPHRLKKPSGQCRPNPRPSANSLRCPYRFTANSVRTAL